MSNRNPSLDGLMRNYGWAVHDFQRLANTISLLVASLETFDDLVAPNFYTDVDTLVNLRPTSPAARRLLDEMGDEDRLTLRKLKKTRDDLMYRFFLDNKINADASAVSSAVLEKLGTAQRDIDAGNAVLNRLYQALATQV